MAMEELYTWFNNTYSDRVPFTLDLDRIGGFGIVETVELVDLRMKVKDQIKNSTSDQSRDTLNEDQLKLKHIINSAYGQALNK